MEVHSNTPLARFTTLKIGGEVSSLCVPASVDELVELLLQLKTQSQPWHILGGGSNLLVSSHGVEGTVIRLTSMAFMNHPEPGIVEAGTGTRVPHLARYAAKLGLSGLEFLVGIPGTVGGCVVMNAGAHGSCVAEVLESATIFDTTDEKLITLNNEQLRFEYRNSIIDPARQVVVSARFKLKDDVPQTILARIQHNEDYRLRTQPINWPSAGSTFKNPTPDKQAGLLLDQAGAKSLREGNAAVSALHANFVINLGGATSLEVTTLLKRMQETVYKSFSVRLKPEWKRLGEFTNSEVEVWREPT